MDRNQICVIFVYRQKRTVIPNRRFLNNTLVSTLRHSYKKDEKTKDGSKKKFEQHMAGRFRSRGRGRFRSLHEDREDEKQADDEEPDTRNVDYGEFDAIKYSEECTDLYIRDSHRKHDRIKQNFVEKTKKGSSSESEESFTEYDEKTKAKKWKPDRLELS